MLFASNGEILVQKYLGVPFDCHYSQVHSGFSLVHTLIVKNISMSSYSVKSNSFILNYSV